MALVENKIYYGRGNAAMYDEYLDFINYVFGFNGRERDFYQLLPKLYRREDDPAGSSYVAVEDGKLRAAIGAFDHTMNVCGQTLVCRSIGNVAVHPYARSKGYMKKLLHMAVDDMIADGVVLSTLGGRRQRYNYFSYEKSGTSYRFSFNPDNFRHCFGTDRTAYHRFTLQVIDEKAENEALLDGVAKLMGERPYVPVRARERLLDILRSWKMVPYAFLEDGVFAGYCVVRGGDHITEIMLCREDRERVRDALVSFYDAHGGGSLTVTVPPFAPIYLETLYPICESYTAELNESYSVLNFEAVCRAFFALKATYESLPAGELCLLIHGRAGDEKLHFSVRDGKPEVFLADPDERPLMALEHLQAINLLFSHFCPARAALPDFARLWFPLPLWMYAADEV